MQSTTYIRLQKQYGGKWVASSKAAKRIYAVGNTISDVMEQLEKKDISPDKTVIGHIQEYGQTTIHLPVSIQKDK